MNQVTNSFSPNYSGNFDVKSFTMTRRQIFLRVLLFLLISIQFCWAQDPIVVFPTDGQSDPNSGLPLTSEEFIAATLIGSGVTIENVKITGDPKAYGAFINNNDVNTSKFEFRRGIILSTGCFADAPGPNDQNIGQSNTCPLNSSGDVDLSNLASVATDDAVILEFDFTTVGDEISFNYIFASEEYTQFVCSQFNDVFAFFISGPNPAGGDYVKENIALIPGAPTPTPISVSTINDGDSDNNGLGNVCILDYAHLFAGSIPELQYEGKTVVLTAKAKVFPCQTYSLKIAIADGTDDNWDSGVFLQAGSINSPEPEITQDGGFVSYQVDANGDLILDADGDPIPLYTDENGNPLGILLESCGEKELTFSIDNLGAASTATINISLTGTAQNGIDYTDEFGNPIPTDITLTATNPSQTIKLVAVVDANPEGIETIIIEINAINGNTCLANSNLLPDTLYINDDLLDVLPTIPAVEQAFVFDPGCSGTQVVKFLDLVGFDSVRYEPSAPIIAQGSDPKSDTDVEAFVEETTTFKVYLFNGPCKDSVIIDQIVITDPILPDAPNIPSIYSICNNDPVMFNLPTENKYTWPTNLNLTCTDCPDPQYMPTGNNVDFDLFVEYANGCKDSIYKIQISYDNTGFITTPNNPLYICGTNAEQVVLNGGETYQWFPTDSLSCSDCPDPFISASAINSYQIVSTNITGCIDTFTLEIQSNDALANAGADIGACEIVDNLTIGNNGYPACYKFTWNPPTGLNDPNIANPTVYLEALNGQDVSRIYELTVESPDGCFGIDSVEVTAQIPGTINIDKGDNITLVIGQTTELNVAGYGLGATYEWNPTNGLNKATGPSVIAKPSESTIYTVTGTSKYGCKSDASIEIKVIEPPSLKFPTAFSPNGDNFNDLFKFYDNDVDEILALKIVNRWGELVYDGVSNNFAGWDGFKDGIKQPIGVYVYYIEYILLGDENIQQNQGHLTLIR